MMLIPQYFSDQQSVSVQSRENLSPQPSLLLNNGAGSNTPSVFGRSQFGRNSC